MTPQIRVTEETAMCMCNFSQVFSSVSAFNKKGTNEKLSGGAGVRELYSNLEWFMQALIGQ